ncbi:hypothetical protein [Cellulomonas sp. PhB143]|uniref:hypothetical protein n=1 Tax=Cellulomonas sp. PhB143 TaxID=2485186 RepID=UPI000F496164|nr:hypothetical protein [Cellulomonas sp. PhB143]ROS78438.1 hypothetical protein EDF32_0334 [Cellulomonas sp. PhB143]
MTPHEDAPPPALRSVGATRTDVEAALRAGNAWRPRRGVYVAAATAPSSAALRRREEALAHVRAVAEVLTTRYWFSHTSAALLWGCWTWRLDPVPHVTQLGRPSGAGCQDATLARHRSDVPAADRAERHGLPVTSLERTVVDCARLLPVPQGLVVADSALRLGARRAEIERRLEAVVRGRGVRRAREVLATMDGRAESPGETLLRHVVVAAGLPPFVPQHEVVTWRGTVRLDGGWPQSLVGVEFDAAVKYSGGSFGDPRARLAAEKERHDALTEAGWRIVRVTWADLRDPERVVARIAALLRRTTASR